MKNLLKTTVCFTTMSLTAILLPMNVMANEGEAKTITIAWTNIYYGKSAGNMGKIHF